MSAEEAAPRAVMSKHGEEFFRCAEAAMIREVIQKYSAANSEPVVISLGGGVPDNRFLSANEVKSLGVLVNLIVDPEVAYSRIAANGIPPFLAGDDPHGKFLELAAARMERYAQLADVQINIDQDISAECLSKKIYEQLLSDGFVRR
jgi:shikimate kinase